MDRNGGKKPPGKRGGRDPGRRPGRRTPPPTATGLESRYFETAKRSGNPLILTMADGETVSGSIESVDEQQITIRMESGARVVRKADIRYISEDG